MQADPHTDRDGFEDTTPSERPALSDLEKKQAALIAKLKYQNAQLMMKNRRLERRMKKLQEPGVEASLVNDKMFSYYTGLPSKKVFEHLLDFITPHLDRVYSETGKPRGPQRQLPPREEFLLVLMRLRLNLQEKDLQYRFKLSSVTRV